MCLLTQCNSPVFVVVDGNVVWVSVCRKGIFNITISNALHTWGYVMYRIHIGIHVATCLVNNVLVYYIPVVGVFH